LERSLKKVSIPKELARAIIRAMALDGEVFRVLIKSAVKSVKLIAMAHHKMRGLAPVLR